MLKKLFLITFLINNALLGFYKQNIKVGSERTHLYLPLLKNKNVALLVNHTSNIKEAHLIDKLLEHKINIKKIFTPEHGFRGEGDAGAIQYNSIDSKTGIPVVSLYGKKKKPTKEDLEGIDVLIFDIQDVGVRFYTYISSLQYFMEAAAENNKPILVLDRPNPNGFYIDGPILEKEFASFVGMQEIPIVYGMTVGEYALMLNGEGLLRNKLKCDLTVISCINYSHRDLYEIPIPPSPNLSTMNAIYLYPSLCLFEGTSISIGRGTANPFEIFGHPSFPKDLYRFIPHSKKGNSNPSYKNQECYGFNLIRNPKKTLKILNKKINLQWIIKAYNLFDRKDHFFNKYFYNLAGTKELSKQIESKMNEEEIRRSWKPGLEKFKKIRKKYLLYEDFDS